MEAVLLLKLHHHPEDSLVELSKQQEFQVLKVQEDNHLLIIPLQNHNLILQLPEAVYSEEKHQEQTILAPVELQVPQQPQLQMEAFLEEQVYRKLRNPPNQCKQHQVVQLLEPKLLHNRVLVYLVTSQQQVAKLLSLLDPLVNGRMPLMVQMN